MDARAVESARVRLDELRVQSVEDVVLAAVAIALAIAGTWLLSAMAVPLFCGGLGVGFLGVRALVRRYLMLDDLVVDRDAYAIADVHRLALRAASAERRRDLAASLRYALTDSRYGVNERVEAVRELLEEIAAALEDERLRFDPACAVALDRLLVNGSTSTLYKSAVPVGELRFRLRRVLDGFDQKVAV